MVQINPTVLTAVVGILGIVFGALLGPFINHRLNVKYARKDFIFKKKLEYFEKIALCLENNLRAYNKTINQAEKVSPRILLKRLKKERENFKIQSSPLYFNTFKLSKRIKTFVRGEKKIFRGFELLSRTDWRGKTGTLSLMKKDLMVLRNVANQIINIMKKEL